LEDFSSKEEKFEQWRYNKKVIEKKSIGLKIDHFLQKSTTFCKVVEID